MDALIVLRSSQCRRGEVGAVAREEWKSFIAVAGFAFMSLNGNDLRKICRTRQYNLLSSNDIRWTPLSCSSYVW